MEGKGRLKLFFNALDVFPVHFKLLRIVVRLSAYHLKAMQACLQGLHSILKIVLRLKPAVIPHD